uniref:Cell division cycle 20 homolog n=1 Tax=Oncorhynchus mykiss TaxID=8022 RepID=A0A8C7SGB0_ONCMY
MAQYGFKNGIHSILKLDMPITNAPMARRQRKAISSTSTNSLSMGVALLAVSSFTNGSTNLPLSFLGKNGKCTTSKASGDCYIPTRNNKQMDLGSFLLSKKNEPMATNPSTATSVSRTRRLGLSLNGYDIGGAKILHLGGKSLNAPEGYQNNLKVLYSQVSIPVCPKKTRYISSVSDSFLKASELQNDFYLNLLDWSSRNLLAVALHNSLPLWDVENQKCLRSMASHTARVASLSWNDYILSRGSRSGHIYHHDVRVDVCGLKWSPDGRYLASGGNDNLVYVWSDVQDGSGQGSSSIHFFSEHQGAVKALAWCPWEHNILASGGGTRDCHIRIWNVNCGSCINGLDTRSQISSLMFAPNYKELVSSHGYSHNNIVICSKQTLNCFYSPQVMRTDCSTIVTVSGDETVRFWKSFELDPVKKKANEMKSTSSIIHTAIQ